MRELKFHGSILCKHENAEVRQEKELDKGEMWLDLLSM